MEKTVRTWTIAAERDEVGSLTGTDGGGRNRVIHFGDEKQVKRLGIAGTDRGAVRLTLTGTRHSMEDTADVVLSIFAAAADAINGLFGTFTDVYVHCKNGRSRTSFALICYLTRHGGLSFPEAVSLVEPAQTARVSGFELRPEKYGPINGQYYGILNSNQGVCNDRGVVPSFTARKVEKTYRSTAMTNKDSRYYQLEEVEVRPESSSDDEPSEQEVVPTVQNARPTAATQPGAKRQKLAAKSDLKTVAEGQAWLERNPFKPADGGDESS